VPLSESVIKGLESRESVLCFPQGVDVNPGSIQNVTVTGTVLPTSSVIDIESISGDIVVENQSSPLEATMGLEIKNETNKA
jgi:hypothetical protein